MAFTLKEHLETINPQINPGADNVKCKHEFIKTFFFSMKEQHYCKKCGVKYEDVHKDSFNEIDSSLWDEIPF